MIGRVFKLVPKCILLKVKKSKSKKVVTKMPYFNENYYLANNIDIFVAEIDPLEHFLKSGQFEGRDPARTISADWIQYKYSKEFEFPFEALVASVKTPKELSPNPLFDPEFYLSQIGDPSELQDMSSYEHFLTIGLEKGFKPNRWLNLESFAISNPWFFNSARSNLEKFTNIFELIRKNMFFDPYLCFVVEDSQSNKFQLTQNLVIDFLSKIEKVNPNSQIEINGWDFIEIVDNLSNSDFQDLLDLENVSSYPPSILDEKINPSFEGTLSQKVVFYCHWDPGNSVANWIEVSLKAWKKLGFEIIFNTNVKIQNLPKFVEDLCSGVIIRSNSGHDFESHLISWNRVRAYKVEISTLVITNDSVYFPVCDLEYLNNCIDSVNFDIWSLTENTWSQRHLQSYFIVLNNKAIERYFQWIENKLADWKYISKTGLINNIELYSHQFAKVNELRLGSLFTGPDPTFKFWDQLIGREIPVLKVHTVRNLITRQAIDPTLLSLKIGEALSKSQIGVEEVLNHARYLELFNKNADYLYP